MADVNPDREFGCADGSCPFHSRLGMHTNGGCKCVYEAFPDEATRRLVDKMLTKAREVATRDAEHRERWKREKAERDDRIRELRTELGHDTDREIIARRRELRAEIERLEMEER